jgi:hypothetical protein
MKRPWYSVRLPKSKWVWLAKIEFPDSSCGKDTPAADACVESERTRRREGGASWAPVLLRQYLEVVAKGELHTARRTQQSI